MPRESPNSPQALWAAVVDREVPGLTPAPSNLIREKSAIINLSGVSALRIRIEQENIAQVLLNGPIIG